jgi:nitrite reductase (NADH) small subunit
VSEPTATTTAPRVDQPENGDSWVHVAEMKELARRKRKQVSVAGCPIALFLVDDEVFAMDDICIHQERLAQQGHAAQRAGDLPRHQWKFDPRTGEAEDQDGCQATYAVQVPRRVHPRRPRAGHTPEGDHQRVLHAPRHAEVTEHHDRTHSRRRRRRPGRRLRRPRAPPPRLRRSRRHRR